MKLIECSVCFAFVSDARAEAHADWHRTQVVAASPPKSQKRKVTQSNDDPLLSLDEVAAYLGRSSGTLRQWRHRGIGPSGFRVGGSVMYRRSVVEAWLNEREVAEA